MGLSSEQSYALSKKYTEDTVEGAGAIKGAPCTIDSIEDIEGGQRVTFKWTTNSGTEQTSEMYVMNGAKGDTGAQGPQGPKGDIGISVPAGGTAGQYLGKKSSTDYDFEWDSVDVELSDSSEHPIQNKVVKAALDGKIATSDIGVAGGIAELNANGKVPESQLPSYVDDVVDGYYKEADGKFYEEATYETEIIGEAGKIYISLDTNIQYRWTGSVFSALGGALVLGETSSTAYRGDRGKIAYDDSQTNKTHIGNLSNLTTEVKTDLVSAINEVSSSSGGQIKYSTEERVVGEWIDGKSVYQKVFVIADTITLNPDGYTRVFIPPETIENVVDMQCSSGLFHFWYWGTDCGTFASTYAGLNVVSEGTTFILHYTKITD